MSDTILNSKPSSRIILIDIFKLICALFIVSYHTWDAFLSDYKIDYTGPNEVWYFTFINKVASVGFYYSGLFIVAVSFFLFGYKESKLKLNKFLLFIPAHIATLYNVNTANLNYFVYWDLFAYIALAYALIIIFSKLPKIILNISSLMGVLFFTMPQLTFLNNYLDQNHTYLRNIIFGDSSGNYNNGWFLIPWIFYPIIFFQLGILFKNNYKFIRYIFFPAAFSLFYYYLAADLNLKSPLNYDAEFFSQKNHALLILFSLPIVIFTIGIKFNKKFTNTILTSVSKFGWTNNFAFSYFTHFVLIILLKDLFQPSFSTINFFPLGILILTGVLTFKLKMPS